MAGRVIGIAMCKDERDIAEFTLRNMATQTDALIVADNGSTDGTRELLDELSRELPLTVIDDPEVGYFQSRKMTALAALAAEDGADWVVAWDFDEMWYSPFGRIADVLCDHNGAVATAAIYDHRPSAIDPEGDPISSIGWRTVEPLPLHKVACRPLLPVTIAQGNHGAHYPTQDPLTGQIVIRHFPYRSVEQFERKVRNGAAAYAATDLSKDVGTHWREYGAILETEGSEALAEVFRTWFWMVDPTANPTLIFDPCPLS